MVCPHCPAILSDEASYCGQCGAALNGGAPANVVLAPALQVGGARAMDRFVLALSVVASAVLLQACMLMEIGAADTDNQTLVPLLLLPPLLPIGLVMLLNGLLSWRGQSIGLACALLRVVYDDGTVTRRPGFFLFGAPYEQAAHPERLDPMDRIFIIQRPPS